MRTTLTIDDQIAAELKEAAHRSGKSFKHIVNEALRTGLHEMGRPQARAYTLRPASLGQPRVGLDQALRVADALEDEAIAAKLEQRK